VFAKILLFLDPQSGIVVAQTQPTMFPFLVSNTLLHFVVAIHRHLRTGLADAAPHQLHKRLNFNPLAQQVPRELTAAALTLQTP
jgi:hypothetical protein